MTTHHIGFLLCLASIAACDLAPKDGGDIVAEGTGSTELDSGDGPITQDDDDGVGTGAQGPTEDTLCQAACVHDTGCSPDYAMAECVEDCLSNLSVFDAVPECDAALHTIVACVGEFMVCDPPTLSNTCSQAENTIVQCEEEYSCGIAGGGPVGSGGCQVEEQCGNTAPRSISCDGETCTCTVDGEVTGDCPAQGVCAAINGNSPLAVTALTCCGFEGFGQPKIPGQ